MKVLDTGEGKILGINFIDLMVLLAAGFLLFSFASQILGKDLSFGGEEMYNAIQSYQRLDSKGFLIEADIKGKWIADESKFHEKGLLLATRGGSFVFKLKDGRRTTIGGSMGYIEDIAASSIDFLPLDNHVILLFIEPQGYTSYEEFLDSLDSMKEKLNADHLLLTADISLTRPGKGTKEIHNELEELYLVKSTPMIQGGVEETIFRVNLAELSELKKLDMESQGITLGATTVIVGYREMPGPLPLEEEYHVASIEELL